MATTWPATTYSTLEKKAKNPDKRCVPPLEARESLPKRWCCTLLVVRPGRFVEQGTLASRAVGLHRRLDLDEHLPLLLLVAVKAGVGHAAALLGLHNHQPAQTTLDGHGVLVAVKDEQEAQFTRRLHRGCQGVVADLAVRAALARLTLVRVDTLADHHILVRSAQADLVAPAFMPRHQHHGGAVLVITSRDVAELLNIPGGFHIHDAPLSSVGGARPAQKRFYAQAT